MVTVLERSIKDFIDKKYQTVKKYLIEYTYEGEKFQHWYDSIKDAKKHLEYLKKIGIVEETPDKRIYTDKQLELFKTGSLF